MTQALSWKRLGYLLVVGGMLTLSGGIASHGQVGSANLSITKSDSPDPVVAAGSLTYTLTVSNAGPDPAAGVTVTDTLPAGVTFVSASGSTWTCTQSLGVVTCTLAPSLASGSSAPPITINITAPNEGGTITNSASVTSAESDPDLTNNSTTATTTVNPSADLSITKSDSPDPVAVGGAVAYTLTVSNAGPSSVPSVTVIDTLPAGVSFVSASGADWACSQTGGVVTCTRATALAVGSAPPITINVAAPSTPGTITNNVTVSSTVSDPASGNNSASAMTSVVPSADLSISKADSTDPVVAGTDLTYAIAVANAGPSDAAAVVVTDPIPAGTSFVSASGGGTFDSTTNTVTWSLGTLPAGSPPVAFTLVARVSSARTAAITNTASVSSSTSDPNSANNSATQSTAVTTSADLSITKTDSPDPVLAGTNLTYTLTVDNAGPSDAQGVVVTDPLPAGTIFVSASGGGVYDPATHTVTWSLGTFTGSQAPTILVVEVQVDIDRTADLTNTVSVGSSTSDPNALNNSDSESTVVSESADMSVAKTDSPDPVIAGTNLTYTLTVDNAGPSNARDVVVTDPIPAGSTFVSASGGGTFDSSTNTVTWSLGVFTEPRPPLVLTLVVKVDPGRLAALSNTATVSSSTPDPASANNSDTETTGVDTSADVSITKTDSPDPVVAGTNLVYTLTVDNAGPSDALSVVVSDPIPSGTSFVSASGGGTFNPGTNTVEWSLGTVTEAQPSVIVTVTVRVASSHTADLSNIAIVSSSTPDQVSANNSAIEPTVVNESAELSIVKTDSPDPVVAGTNLIYTLTVDNAGPSDASSVVVSDLIPSGSSFVSASSGGIHDPVTNTVTWSLGTFTESQAPVALTLTVIVDSSQTADLSNTATVSSTTPDPVSANNSATEPTAVTTAADLSIAKTDSPDPVVAGTMLTYTIAVSNAGPSDATEVVVTDPLPPGVGFMSATGGGSYDPLTNTVTWSLGTLGAGDAPVAVALVVQVSPAQTASVSNTASVASSTLDPNIGNNSDTESTDVVAEADLAVTKTDSPDPVVAGQQITYTVTVQNLGPSNATNVEVTDALPAETTIVSLSSDCTDNADGTVTCGPIDLVAGASVSWEIVVVVEKVGTAVQDGSVLTNRAEVTSDTLDPNSANDQVDEDTTVSAPNISLTKTAVPESGTEVSPGELILFTITYTNSGSAAASGFLITDTVDALLGEVTPSAGGVFDPDTRTITWTFTDPIGPAGSPTSTGTVSFTGRLGSITGTRTIRNQGLATATEYQEPVKSNTTSTTARPPDVLITKDANLTENSEVKPFDVITYRLTIRNRGGGRAIGVVVTDAPPPYLNYVANSTRVDGAPVADSGGTSPLFGAGIALGTLDPGDDSFITFQMTVDVSAPAGALLENWGYATWNIGTRTSGDFVDLRVLRPRTGPALRQSILVQSPTGRTILVTVVSEFVELLPITGYQSVLLALLGLAALGFGRASTMRIDRDLFRRGR